MIIIFKELIFHHYINTVTKNNIDNSADLISKAFSQINSFTEFVRSSEGIPRDAINILSIAASKATDNKISVENIRSEARTWYSRGKEKAITSNQEAHKLPYKDALRRAHALQAASLLAVTQH